jgi:peptide/nickel transport system permease protein
MSAIQTQTKSPVRSLPRELLHELTDFLHRSVPGRWGFALTLLLAIVALAAPFLAPYDPVAQNLPARLLAPTAAHWMGTDELGRDILSRIIFGTRVSMLVSVCVVFGAGVIGLAIGAVAGYFGGWFDRFDKVILALVVTGWAGYARLARAQILQAKEMEYVLAARSLGASHARILVRHLLPNILQPILVQATIAMAGAILAESTLSFLGVGVLAPMPSWGAMLNDARGHLFDAPHLVIFPALAVMTAVLAFNLLGDALRDWLDPRMRSYLIITSLAR